MSPKVCPEKVAILHKGGCNENSVEEAKTSGRVKKTGRRIQDFSVTREVPRNILHAYEFLHIIYNYICVRVCVRAYVHSNTYIYDTYLNM